jgi:hypothetical protein
MSTSSGEEDAEKLRVKAEREARKDAKAAHKAEKERTKAEAAVAKEAAEAVAATKEKQPISHLALDDPDAPLFGDYETIMSQGKSGRVFSDIEDLKPTEEGEKVWVRGRVQTVRQKGSSAFLVLRQGAFTTMQAVKFKAKAWKGGGADNCDDEGGWAAIDAEAEAAVVSSGRLLKWLGALTPESVVELQGSVVEAQVKSCSKGDVELVIDRAYAVVRAGVLPFQLEDAARPEAEVMDDDDVDDDDDDVDGDDDEKRIRERMGDEH